MKILLISILSFCLFQNSYSQSVIYKGEKSFQATNTWAFDLKNSSFEKVKISVAKVSPKAGYLMISKGVFFDFEHVGGLIILYLDNGTVISLSTRVSSDNTDNESIVLYSLSQIQINNLKESSIRVVRFSIIGKGTKSSYTAENNGDEPTYFDNGKRSAYNTGNEISELFNEE